MIDLNHSRNLAVRPGAGCSRDLFLWLLIAALGWLLAGPVTAQTFTTLHSFTATSTNSFGAYTNSDGSYPVTMIFSDKTLYGVAGAGGNSGNGTIFKVGSDGSGFSTLHDFTTSSTTAAGIYTNNDGAFPVGLVLSGNTLYGAAGYGGGFANGTVFKVNTDGTTFEVLHQFTAGVGKYPLVSNIDGATPSFLAVSGSTVYGTTRSGGDSSMGAVFKVNTDGTGFTNLHSFAEADGINPSGFVVSGNFVYGTFFDGGNSGAGTLFRMNIDGTGFTNLHSFAGYDGGSPSALAVSGNMVYGGSSGQIDERGFGPFRYANVFRVNTDGAAWTNLQTVIGFGSETSDFAFSPLIISGHLLYGTVFDDTSERGGYEHVSGSAFALDTDGTLTTLYRFPDFDRLATTVGGYRSILALADNGLYGIESQGGSLRNGTIFSLSFTPQLTVMPFENEVVLTWPTNYAGFDYSKYFLQSTTNLTSGVWSYITDRPVSGTDFVVVRPRSDEQRFYRLAMPLGCKSSLDCPCSGRCIIPTGQTVGSCQYQMPGCNGSF